MLRQISMAVCLAGWGCAESSGVAASGGAATTSDDAAQGGQAGMVGSGRSEVGGEAGAAESGASEDFSCNPAELLGEAVYNANGQFVEYEPTN